MRSRMARIVSGSLSNALCEVARHRLVNAASDVVGAGIKSQTFTSLEGGFAGVIDLANFSIPRIGVPCLRSQAVDTRYRSGRLERPGQRAFCFTFSVRLNCI